MTTITRPSRRWLTYRVTSPGHGSIIIIANDMLDALAMALEYRRLRGIAAARLTIDPSWGSSLSGIGLQHLEEARAICREPSIATLYQADIGWAVGGPELGLEEA